MMFNRGKAAKIRLSSKERLQFFSDLSTMLTAGIPILEAVDSLEADAKGSLKRALSEVRHSLTNGEPLSRALGRLSKTFDPVTINLIRASEAGGTLEQTLHDVVVTSKQEMHFSDQLRDTMIYPTFVMVIFLAIVVLMLTFVVPRVASVFLSLNVPMPLVTRIMIQVSTFFIAYWLLVAIGFVLTIMGIGALIAANKRLIARVILSLPLLRTLGTNIDLARFTRSLGLLLRAGVPVVEALDYSEKVVQKKQIIAVINEMHTDIQAGKQLGTSLRRNKKVIPAIMWRSIETAETSGALDETLQNLTQYFDEQVTDKLKVLSSLVEPMLLILVGSMVGLLMVSIIAPIYSMISDIKPGR